MDRLLHSTLKGVFLLCCLFPVQVSWAQCNTDASDALFQFTPGRDTIFVGEDCMGTLRFGTPMIEPLRQDQVIDEVASGIDFELTGANEDEVFSSGTTLDVYLVGVEAAPSTVRDTFCYTLRFVDNIAPSFLTLPTNLTACLADVPEPIALQAMDNCSDLGMIFPVDDTLEMDFCGAGGMIRRTWTARDEAGQETVVAQVITVTADTEAPSSGYTPMSASASCREADFEAWVADEQNKLLAQVNDDCGLASMRLDTLEQNSCGMTRVAFVLVDFCGNEAALEAIYTVADTTAIEFIGVPNDTTVSCTTLISDAPLVEANSSCGVVDTVMFSEGLNDFENECGGREFYRIWTAFFICPDRDPVQVRQVIMVHDSIAPMFDLPEDLTVDCGEDQNDIRITGEPQGLIDNCTGVDDLIIEKSDQDFVQDNLLWIHRTWEVSDACLNRNSQIQIIGLMDTVPPSFDVPFDIEVDCDEVDDIRVTGFPTMIVDNCDPDPSVRFEDMFTAGGCVGGGAIERMWIVSDATGNADTLIQRIIVEDEEAPVITVEASDFRINCGDDVNTNEEFGAWLEMMGGAMATDNCTSDTTLSWEAYNSGTTVPASLPRASCPSDSMGLYRGRLIDFIVRDKCGNSAMTSARFDIVDTTPPRFAYCPPDTILQADNNCEAQYGLVPPRIVEICGSFPSTSSIPPLRVKASSQSPGNRLVPVDTIRLSFPVLPSEDFPSGNVMLTIKLINMDIGGGEEYFNVVLEGGTVIGRTLNGLQGAGECADSETVLTTISAEQIIEAAGSNSLATFFLIPNEPLPGTDGTIDFSRTVNDICMDSSWVEATLMYESLVPRNMSYHYRLNNDRLLGYAPYAQKFLTLETGEHTLTYFATDCAGNRDSCMYTVTVEDGDDSHISCPRDVVLPLDSTGCSAAYELPLPVLGSGTCSARNSVDITLPTDPTDALITFSFASDLNDYLAQDKVFLFEDLMPNAIEDVTLEISIQGDIDGGLGFFNIIGDDGIPMATTMLEQENVTNGDCSSFSVTTIMIPANLYNIWAEDGQIQITANSNQAISIPPGGPGDGVNPCNPDLVQADGDSDGTSMIFATLKYSNLQYAYHTEGATEIPSTMVSDTTQRPTVVFNLGTTEVFYTVQTGPTQTETCSFIVEIADIEAPVIVCGEKTIFVNPSGAFDYELQADEIDLGSTDNCGIDSMFVTPSRIPCDTTEIVDVILTVVDTYGNQSTCETFVRVEKERPQPSYTLSSCNTDTLRLFANPPASPSNIEYIFEWNGPNDFFSQEENPIISNIDDGNAGSYRVEVTGITGCMAIGAVEVSVNDLSTVPVIDIPERLCSNDTLVLRANTAVQSNDQRYRWYEGSRFNGNLIGVTTTPSLTINPAPEIGSYEYYVEIEANACTSLPSETKLIEIIEVPTANIFARDTILCEGEDIRLQTFVSDPSITYEWTGPDGYSSSLRMPPIIDEVTEDAGGIYQLITQNNGCSSDPSELNITVLPRPDQPDISLQNTPLCAGDSIILTTMNIDSVFYHWFGPDFIERVTTEPTFGLEGENQYQGEWTLYLSRGVCFSEQSDPINVDINPQPELLIAANPTPVCIGGQLVLNASSTVDGQGTTYEWSTPGGGLFVRQNPIVNNITVEDEGTYACTVTTAAGCTDNASLFVDVESIEITGISTDAQECMTGARDVRLRATTFPEDNSNYRYRWTGPNGFTSFSPDAVITNATSEDSGTYTLVVTTDSGCAADEFSQEISISRPPSTPSRPRVLLPAFPNALCVGARLEIETTAYSGTQVEYHWETPRGRFMTTIPTFSINEVNLNDDGNYSLYVIVDGCQSNLSGTIFIEVSRTPEVMATSTSPVCEGEVLILEATSGDLDDIEYNWRGPIDFRGRRQVIDRANSNIHAGVYTVIADNNGCKSLPDTVEVIISQTPNVPQIVNNGPICIGDSAAVLRLTIPASSSTVDAQYVWYNDQLEVISDTTSNLVLSIEGEDLNAYNDGTTRFYVEAIQNGCSSMLSPESVVTFNTIPENAAFAGEDLGLCDGESIQLNASEPAIGEGYWTLLDEDPTGSIMIVNPGRASTTIAGLVEDGQYTFQWTLTNGACADYSSDQIIISVNPTDAANAGPAIDTCSVSSLHLNADPTIGGNGRWTQPPAQELLGVEIVDPNDPNTEITGLVPSNQYFFTWSISGGSCGESEDIAIVFVSGGFAYAGTSFSTCGDDCVMLEAEMPPNGRGLWTSPNFNIIFNDPRSAETMACGLEDGSNMLIWTVDDAVCGDRARDTIFVTYQQTALTKPDTASVDFGSAVNVDVIANDRFDDPLATITILRPPLNGTVTEEDYGLFRYQADVSFTGIDAFEYEICLSSDECDCVTERVTITVGGQVNCIIPDIITPNGDSVNDAFVVPCLNDKIRYPENEVIVFNQWGDEVFRVENYNNDWGGTYDGERLPNGTYFYIVDFKDEEIPSTGFLIIHR